MRPSKRRQAKSEECLIPRDRKATYVWSGVRQIRDGVEKTRGGGGCRGQTPGQWTRFWGGSGGNCVIIVWGRKVNQRKGVTPSIAERRGGERDSIALDGNNQIKKEGEKKGPASRTNLV